MRIIALIFSIQPLEELQIAALHRLGHRLGWDQILHRDAARVEFRAAEER